MKNNFYPSYIPKKWIHYTRHKKSRIRKKYQNRILRYVRQHERDAETSLFLLYNTQSRLGMSTQEFWRAAGHFGKISASLPSIALIGGNWNSGARAGLFTAQVGHEPIEVIGLQQYHPELERITDEVAAVNALYSQEDLKKINEAFQQLADALVETLKPAIDCIIKLARKLVKWARDVVDRLWCNNRRWWYMAEHHKKYRIRKKYRSKINREAARKARELLPLLTEDSEEDAEPSDEEEGP